MAPMERGLSVAAIATACVLSGCAQPGDVPDGKTEVTVTFEARAASCGNAIPMPVRVTPTAQQSPDPLAQRRREQALRNQANKAGDPCADRVRAVLNLIRAQDRYDAALTKQVLTGEGLTDVTVRPAGGGRLFFTGRTGQACIYGEVGPQTAKVGMAADGRCPAEPD